MLIDIEKLCEEDPFLKKWILVAYTVNTQFGKILLTKKNIFFKYTVPKAECNFFPTKEM